MKVLLISPKTKIWNLPTQIPLGLAYLAASLQQASHKVEVWDEAVEKRSLAKHLKKGGFNLIGITANTSMVKRAWEIAEKVKKFSRALVVLGGPHPTALSEESLNQPGVDVVVRGEGEETILEIAAGKPWSKIAGISYRKNKRVYHNPDRSLNRDLDDLPRPAYELFKLGRYSVTQPLRDRQGKNQRAFYIMTSRGCPHSCIYCFKRIAGRVWRPRSPQNVVAEWRYLIEELGATEIGVQDDVFNLDRQRTMTICKLLIKNKLNNVPWITNNGLRADRVDLKLLQTMKKAGCKRVGFGVESGSQKILDKIDKNLSLHKIRRAFILAKKAGLETMGFFMFGNLGEDEETMKQTINLSLELDPDIAHFSIATPFPGTKLFEVVKSKGQLLSSDWEQYGILEGRAFFWDKVSAQKVEQYWRQAYRRFYLRPKRLLKEVTQLDNWKNLLALSSAAKRYFIK